MWRRWFSEALYAALGKVQGITGVLAILFTASLRAPPDRWARDYPFIADVLRAMQETAWFMLLLLLGVGGLAGLLRRYTGPPWVWALIETMLTQFGEEVFAPSEDSEAHHHRATLFKHVTWRPCWPPSRAIFQGWLVPVARSGHTTRARIARFRAPDEADRAEGIAGKVWAKNGTVLVSQLPNLAADQSDEAFEKYARATRVSVEWLKKKPVLARSLGGFPIQVKGKPWGVVVLDSRSPEGVVPESFSRLQRLLARFVGQLLERTGL